MLVLLNVANQTADAKGWSSSWRIVWKKNGLLNLFYSVFLMFPKCYHFFFYEVKRKKMWSCLVFSHKFKPANVIILLFYCLLHASLYISFETILAYLAEDLSWIFTLIGTGMFSIVKYLRMILRKRLKVLIPVFYRQSCLEKINCKSLCLRFSYNRPQ